MYSEINKDGDQFTKKCLKHSGSSIEENHRMKRMWIQLKKGSNHKSLEKQLSQFGRIEWDNEDKDRLILTFRQQSEDGVRMACFQLSENFMQYFEDFDMIRD
jgi:hypothetical protein